MQGEKFIDVDGIRTRYFVQGTGEALMLLHGGHFGAHETVTSAEMWDRNIDGLSGSFQVFALDRLGQGFTDNPKNGDYTMRAVIDHAYGFIQAMGLQRVSLIGQSRGAFVAARLALEHPELVKALILVGSGTLAPTKFRSQEEELEGIPRPLRSKESLRWQTAQFSYSTTHITEDYLDTKVRIAELPKVKESIEKMTVLEARLFLPNLQELKNEALRWISEGRLKTPVLLVWGYNDQTATMEGGLELFHLIASSTPRAHMHIFNEARHYPYREHPDDFNALVTSFVRGS